MKIFNLIISAVLILFKPACCSGQEKRFRSLTTGDTISDVPYFSNVMNVAAGKLSLKALKGKLVVLDFWSTGCSSCIAAIPHLEALQQQFKERLQIIMVNPWETKEKILQRVSKMKILRPGIGLTSLPNVYGDTIWRQIFPHTDLPHHVWIDKMGVVIASTSSVNLTQEHIQLVLDGKKLIVAQKKDLKLKGYDVRKSGLVFPVDTSIHISFYSAFFKGSHSIGSGSQIKTDTVHQLYRRSIFNEPVLQLFKIASQGGRILFALNDVEKFQRPKDPNRYDEWFDRNCYSYEITLPMQRKDSIFSLMRQDLSRYFELEKGIKAQYEFLDVPTYVLGKASVKSPVMKTNNDRTDANTVYNFKNVSFITVRNHLKASIEDLSVPMAFEDETQVADKTLISLTVPKDVSNKEQLSSVLLNQGFSLRLEMRRLKVFVVR